MKKLRTFFSESIVWIPLSIFMIGAGLLAALILMLSGCGVPRKQYEQDFENYKDMVNTQYSVDYHALDNRLRALERDHRIRSGLEAARERKRDEEAYIKEKCAERKSGTYAVQFSTWALTWEEFRTRLDEMSEETNDQPSLAKPRDAEWTECIKSDTGTITNGHFVFPCLIELIGLTDHTVIWRKP